MREASSTQPRGVKSSGLFEIGLASHKRRRSVQKAFLR